jgi:hypothetical protein
MAGHALCMYTAPFASLPRSDTSKGSHAVTGNGEEKHERKGFYGYPWQVDSRHSATGNEQALTVLASLLNLSENPSGQ